MSRDAGLPHLDTYLIQVQRHLGGLPEAEVRETLAELRSHVLDKVAGDLSVARIEAAISELGAPRDIARINVTERVVAGLETNRSPVGVLRAVMRLASVSVYGLVALLLSVVGYSFGAALVVTAAVKPFMPEHAGLWRIPDGHGSFDYSLGATDAPRGQELLGWWIIPIGLVLGALICWMTWRFGLASVRRMGRAARRDRS